MADAEPEPNTNTSPDPNPKQKRRRVKRKKTFLQRARGRILSGFVLIVPIVVTIFVARFLYDFIAGTTKPITDKLMDIPFWKELAEYNIVPGANVIATAFVTLSVLYLFGFISTTIVIKRIYTAGEALLLRIPLLKDIYGLSKQVIELALSDDKVAFKYMALFEFPSSGRWALGFITGESKMSGSDKLYANILMPFAPIPTQLFLMLIPADQILVVDIPIENALKFLMSGGSVSPGEFSTRPFTSMADLEAKNEEMDWTMSGTSIE